MDAVWIVQEEIILFDGLLSSVVELRWGTHEPSRMEEPCEFGRGQHGIDGGTSGTGTHYSHLGEDIQPWHRWREVGTRFDSLMFVNMRYETGANFTSCSPWYKVWIWDMRLLNLVPTSHHAVHDTKCEYEIWGCWIWCQLHIMQSMIQRILNSLACWRFDWNFRWVTFKLILVIYDWGFFSEIAAR